jgi:hypothetical protein
VAHGNVKGSRMQMEKKLISLGQYMVNEIKCWHDSP